MFKYAERKSTAQDLNMLKISKREILFLNVFVFFFFSGTSSLFIREPKQSSLADDSA